MHDFDQPYASPPESRTTHEMAKPFSTDLYGNNIERPNQQRVSRNDRYGNPNTVVNTPLDEPVIPLSLMLVVFVVVKILRLNRTKSS